MLVVGPDRQQVRRFKQLLAQQFEIQDLGEASSYLGMGITRDRASRAPHLSRQQLVSKFNTEQARPQEQLHPACHQSTTVCTASGKPLGSMLGVCIDSVGTQVWCKKQYSCGCDTPQPCVQCSPLAISGWRGSLSTVSMPCWACTRTTNKPNDYPQHSSASGHGHCDMAHVHGW